MQAKPDPRSTHPGIFARIVSLGSIRGTLVMTLVCIGASLILAVVITSALHRLSLMGILISLAIPTIIAYSGPTLPVIQVEGYHPFRSDVTSDSGLNVTT